MDNVNVAFPLVNEERGMDLSRATTNQIVEEEKEKALSINILALIDNPLRSIQKCETAEAARDKSQLSYFGEHMVDKLGLLCNLFILRWSSEINTVEQVSNLESQFSCYSSSRSSTESTM